ncbi:MAG TPA: hypothetical protein VK190_04900 [Pseudoneobacillus sp.]|nr:hypothetical protein [Pseudoneobacillus sp.]
MEEQKKLRELTNTVRITGTVKEINLEVKPNKKEPHVKQIQGNIIVQTVQGDKVNEHRVELFAKESSKLFKGYDTIRREALSIESHGKDAATRVTVTGSIDGNDYVGQDGQLRENNRVRGLFVNRLEGDQAATPDAAVAQIELVVTNIRPIVKNEEETGEFAIDAFTIGYNNSVIKLQNLVVGEDLANVISDNYEPNSTGKLTFQINNYVEVVEREVDPLAETAGFGVQVDLGNEARNYTRNLKVIGGFPPYLDERALDEEDIRLAQQIRALKVQEVLNAVPATPPTQPGGFGNNGFGDPFANSNRTIDISDDDLPF